jgi:large subunit ribosomal protein L29
MKATEIRQMGRKEIVERIDQEEENLLTLRFQHASSQLTDTSKIRKGRQDVARLRTILIEMDQREEGK